MTWGNIRMADQLDLSGREWEQAKAYYEIVSRYGQWNQGPLSDGSHYFQGEENPFIDEGMMCGNCVFYLPNGRCQIVQGFIDYEGLCKLWIIPDSELEV